MEESDNTSKPQTLAAKLDRLFRTIHPRDKAEYSFEDVASAIRDSGGPTISATYIWQLRKGLRDNPTKRHLEALAGFFDVSPAYFIDDEVAERIDAELDLLVALRDAPVKQIALRAAGLSRESLAAITDVIERVRQLEGLPDTDPSEGERQRAGGRGSEGEGERQRAGGRGSEGEGERQRAGGRGSEDTAP